LASIPEDFQYPEDILDFVESGPCGKEMIWIFDGER
jgi:antitoxin MazE